MNNSLIKPQTLKGFRDFLPQAALARERVIDVAKRVYRGFGFAPIDTPALEYTEILLGKGGDESDKQMFRFQDQGGRDVAMRFDLTVPFARFAAQHSQDLGLPFKRYHVGPVWRGERPQKGRFREFIQCDFDTIGTDSPAADVETLLVIHELFLALGFTGFAVRVNHRGVLNGMLQKFGVRDRAPLVLRSLDKLAKIGVDAVVAELVDAVGLDPDVAGKVVEFTALEGSPTEVLSQAKTLLAGVAEADAGLATLGMLFDAAAAAGVPESRLRLDLGIARGLDYYTGTIYETFLDDLPSIGSVCSGGRYDNLAGLFTKLPLPGIGASLGVDRLLAAMEELGLVEEGSTPAQVLVTQFDGERLVDYVAAAAELRRAGLNVELYPDAKDIAKQLKYASRKGHAIVLIAGADEFAAGNWQIKVLSRREQQTVAAADMVPAVRAALATPGTP